MASPRRDYAFVILASVFWGTSFPATKLIVGAVDPLVITAARLAIGAVLGFAVLAILQRLDMRVMRRPIVWGLGLVNAFAFDLQNTGLAYTTASKTALLVNVNVVFIAILMVLVYRERVTSYKVAGIAVGLSGVVVLATKLNPETLAGGQFLGDILVFLSGLAWSFYVVGTKKMVDRGGDYIALTTGILAATAVFAFVPVFALGVPMPSGAIDWTAIAYLGLVPTFTPMLLYVYSMRTISPTISALLILLEVIVAGVIAFAMFSDPLDAFTFAGGALILLGAYVVARGEKEIPEPGASGLAPVPSDTAVPGPDGFTRP